MRPMLVTSPEKRRVKGKKKKEGETMTEITLLDGRIFNSRFSDWKNAFEDVRDYLFCEYNEVLNENDIVSVEVEQI